MKTKLILSAYFVLLLEPLYGINFLLLLENFYLSKLLPFLALSLKYFPFYKGLTFFLFFFHNYRFLLSNCFFFYSYCSFDRIICVLLFCSCSIFKPSSSAATGHRRQLLFFAVVERSVGREQES